MTEWVELQVCIKFCIKLEHSSSETTHSEGCSNGQLVIGSFITTMYLFVHHISCTFWGGNNKSLMWLSPTTAQIWCPETSGFSQNYNHLWKGRDFSLSMRFRKIWWGSWWWLGKLCEVPRCLHWRWLRCHCPMYSVSCIVFNKCLYFSYCMTRHLLDMLWY